MAEAVKIEHLNFSQPVVEAEDLSDKSLVSAVMASFKSRFERREREYTLKDVSFKLDHGETLCISGASGQGKSLFLRILAGLERPDEPKPGEAPCIFYYFGELLPLEKHNALEIAGRQVSFVPQNSALISDLSVYDNVALPLRYHKRGTEREIDGRVNMALEIMRVQGFKRDFPHELSTGIRKRVAIARAWAMNPKLLLMDEPTIGLDNYDRRNLLPLIDNMKELFKTPILIVTHDLEIAQELGCKISLMHDKKLTEPQTFDQWLKSKKLFAEQLFRDYRAREEIV